MLQIRDQCVSADIDRNYYDVSMFFMAFPWISNVSIIIMECPEFMSGGEYFRGTFFYRWPGGQKFFGLWPGGPINFFPSRRGGGPASHNIWQIFPQKGSTPGRKFWTSVLYCLIKKIKTYNYTSPKHTNVGDRNTCQEVFARFFIKYCPYVNQIFSMLINPKWG